VADESTLHRLYDQRLGKGPFPTAECAQAGINGKLHMQLILYVADVAGLASRGEQGLATLSQEEKIKFRTLISRNITEKSPELRRKITPDATPKLHALLDATENARELILKALDL